MSALWTELVRCTCGAMTRNPEGSYCLCLPRHEHPEHDGHFAAALRDEYEAERR